MGAGAQCYHSVDVKAVEDSRLGQTLVELLRNYLPGDEWLESSRSFPMGMSG